MKETTKDFIAIIAIFICIGALMALSHHEGYKDAEQDYKNEIINKVIYQMEGQEKLK